MCSFVIVEDLIPLLFVGDVNVGITLFIIFLSWFFLWEKESCDEDKGIIVNSVPTLTKTYSEYTVKIPYDEKGNRATKIFILMPSTLRIDYYDIQTDSNYLAFKVHDDNQTPYECIVRFEYSEDVSVNDFVSFDNNILNKVIEKYKSLPTKEDSENLNGKTFDDKKTISK